MSFQQISNSMLPVIEQELQQTVMQAHRPGLEDLVAMMTYHMGWEGRGSRPGGARQADQTFAGVAMRGRGRWRLALRPPWSGGG